MTTIKATCPTCGEVSLTPEQIELRIDHTAAAESYYAFTCPACTDLICKPADERVIRLLLSGGVEARDVDEPVYVRTRLDQRFDFPPFTHDDLLDFHHLLKADGWFELVLALTGRENVK